MRRLPCALVPLLLLLVAVPGRAGDFPVVRLEGRPYVKLDHLAATLGTRPDSTPSSIKAYLRTPGHVVTLTRNWAQILVDGAPLVLEAPVRVHAGVWLVPEAFTQRVLPRLGRVGPTVARAPAPLPAALPRTAARPAALEEVRLRSYPSFTRVVLETSEAVSYRVEAAGGKEARVRIPALAGEPRVDEVRDGFIAQVRLERSGADAVLRVVFEAPVAGQPKVETLADPYRLVLDFERPTDVERERAVNGPLRTIVLDAGHGGHDSGAQGPTGLMEKELVLDVTRRVARLVEDKLGIKVLLSRAGDHFVTLRDRTSFANRERADLFVSIHANAHRDMVSEGVETYFLSSEATDNAARQVAALENSAIQLEASPARGGRGPDVVKAILWDLAQSEFQAESSRLAETVQDSMTRSLRIPNRGVKQAGFYVLGGAAMPAVLVEIGFVTSPREERKLKGSRYRDEIARAIYTGLAEYKRNWDQRTRATVERHPR